MDVTMMPTRLVTALALLATLASSGCGAPTQKAKVANAVLNLLTSVLLGYASKDPASTSVDIPCGDGSDEAGSFRYDVPAILSDPLELIRNPNAAIALA